MKLTILNTQNESAGQLELPAQFGEQVREDLIRRAVLTIEANNRQKYGVYPEAGKQHSTFLSKRRRKYRGVYGSGMSRTPKKIMNRSGIRFGYVGAFAPMTRGGRVAHPPKAEKIWDKKLNIKERRAAIRSALSATMNKDWVSKRGHKVPSSFPFLLSKDFESLSKTQQVVEALNKLGLAEELQRSQTTKLRGGAAALRGRKRKKTVGPLFVVSKSCELQKAARNIPGIDVVVVDKINAKALAPGCHAGRLTLYTEGAVQELTEKKLFA